MPRRSKALGGCAAALTAATLLLVGQTTAVADTTSGPSAAPDRITLNPTADNTTTQTVSWRSAAGTATPQAQISPDTANPWGFRTTTVPAQETHTQTTDLGYTQDFHSATFTGLQPGTTYLYRVGDGSTWSGWMPLTTSDPGAERTSLIAMGDIQTGIKDHWTRVAAAAHDDRPDAAAMITVGDQVNNFDRDAQWDELFTAAGSIPREMMWIPAVGNHEYRSTDSGELTPQFRNQFALPANGPDDFPHFEETAYFTDVDDVRVVTMNTYYRIPVEKAEEQRWLDAQAAWLRQVLADNPREWTIVNMHYPVYSSSPDRGNPELRATLEPVFEEFGVDLVLQGHDHAYVSGQRDMGARDTGPLYVTSSSSNRQYPLDYSDWVENGADPVTGYHSRSTYQLIDVEGDRMTYTAKDSTGAITDQWTIEHKGKDNKVRHVQGVGLPE